MNPSPAAPDQLTLESLLARMDSMAQRVTGLEKALQEKDEIITQQQAEIQRLHQVEIHERDLKILKLTHELTQLKKLVFGAKSERFVPALPPQQLALFQNAPAMVPPAIEQITYTRKSTPKNLNHPGRLPLPAHLPRQRVVLEPAGVDTTAWKKIGEEITEELDYAPGRLFVRQYVRPKYVCPAKETAPILCAPLPERPIARGIAGPGLLGHVILSKYVNHMPVYRQLQQFRREGITIPASTVNDWIRACCQLLEPLYEQLLLRVQESGYAQADESPIPVLDKDKKGSTHRGYMWLYHAPAEKLVLFDYRRGRGREGPTEILAGFRGYLQTDAYSGYDSFDDRDGITRLCCWAHARRKFVEAEKNDAARSAYALEQIQRLYALERQAREENYTPAQTLELRRQKAVPVLEEFHGWLTSEYQLVAPSSAIGKALSYTLTLWDKLLVYTRDGRLHIDNNLIENQVRPLALGRKNYMFCGSHEGAQRAAMLYSFMGCCKLWGINPQEWLTDVLERMPSHPVNRLSELLPGQWKPTQAQ